MRALALSVALAAGLVAGCSLLPHPPPPAVAPTVTEIPDALGATYIVKPWPHNAIVAFLCLRDPGDSFSIMHPKPDPDAGCAALSTRKDGETLTFTFRTTDIGDRLADEFARSSGPWHLAFGGFDAVTVLDIENSPIASDPGPS